MANALTDLCDFIHEAQKERGSVSLYLRSKNSEFSDVMESQFTVVDGTSKGLKSLPKMQSSRIEPLLNAIHYLPAKRKYVIARMLEPAEALSFYTRDIVAPAIDIVQELAVLDPVNHPARISAFVHFLQWKERVGLEGALGTQLVDPGLSASPDVKDRLEYLISEQQAYERMFLALSDEKGRVAIEKLKKEHAAFQKIEAIHQSLKNGTLHQLAVTISAQ